MNARDRQIARQRMTLAALAAIAAKGGRFYDALGIFQDKRSISPAADLPGHVAEWIPSIRNAVCSTYTEACEAQAFALEADDGSGHMRGYRLIRLGAGPSKTGHAYSGETFRDADTMWSVMRTIEDLATHPACETKAPASPERPRSIMVIGRRWFDRANGNTYHVAEVWIDGRHVHRSAFTYGYEDHYLETAAEWLESQGIVSRERYASGGREPLRLACERIGIVLAYTHADVSRRKDLPR